MNDSPVTVETDGQLITRDANNLRVNDLVVIQAGEIVPADLKLVEARTLEVDEFEITGELLPVTKGVEDVTVYSGSRVTRGAGKGIVIAVGAQTEYGRILAQTPEEDISYHPRIFVTRYLRLVVLLFPAFILQLAVSHDPVSILALYGLLSVVLILLQNDGFFASSRLSIELNTLKHSGIHVRDWTALELMNEIDVICFDKTGVLTSRQMTVKRVHFADRVCDEGALFHVVNEHPASVVKIACALCNDVYYPEKLDLANPVDRALIAFARNGGVAIEEILPQYRRLYDVPFDSERRHMTCGFEVPGDGVLHLAKGDPDIILRMCDTYLTATGTRNTATLEFRLWAHASSASISHGGDSVIALAYARNRSEIPPGKYTFLCLVDVENPLQPEVPNVIEQVTRRGITSLLLTGDRTEAAMRIGEDSGITKDKRVCLTGRMIDRMDLPEIARQAAYRSVFARLTPSQKGLLVAQLRQNGHIVAMIGDGPNDGVALKVADVGIALMPNSSPIARRLSKILVKDLAGLLTLMESAGRLSRRVASLKAFRVLTMAIVLLGAYAAALILQPF